MTGFTTVRGTPGRIERDNVDTDQLIPARFMSRPRSEGYGPFLLYDMAEMRPAQGTEILVAGRNFGCGSSREAAVYALVDFGIKAVLAPSFGDIFASNAVNNGLLPAVVPAEALEALTGELLVDLDACEIRDDTSTIPFQIDPVWREKLLKGWDDIDLTAQHRDRIATFKLAYQSAKPWTVPG